MNYYTYAFLREDGTPYYIGKGSGRRYYSKAGRNIGMPPRERIIKLKQNLTEEQAFAHERYLIAVLPNLYNLTEGGEGASGHKKSDKFKKEQAQRMRDNNPMSDPAIVDKMRKSQTGKKQSAETVNKRKATIEKMGGVKLTAEQKEKISKASKGKPKSEAHRKALKDAWVRRKAKQQAQNVL